MAARRSYRGSDRSSVILAAVLLKMGTYGLMRFCFTLFPDQSREFAPLYSSCDHRDRLRSVGRDGATGHEAACRIFVGRPHGICDPRNVFVHRVGNAGRSFTMLAHGVTTGALFLLVGFIYERRHTRAISEFGGLANVMPIYATIFVITSMASVGLPFLMVSSANF